MATKYPRLTGLLIGVTLGAVCAWPPLLLLAQEATLPAVTPPQVQAPLVVEQTDTVKIAAIAGLVTIVGSICTLIVNLRTVSTKQDKLFQQGTVIETNTNSINSNLQKSLELAQQKNVDLTNTLARMEESTREIARVAAAAAVAEALRIAHAPQPSAPLAVVPPAAPATSNVLADIADNTAATAANTAKDGAT